MTMSAQNKLHVDNVSSGDSIILTSKRKEPSPIHRVLIATTRIAFGIAWAVGAWLKWQPTFLSQVADQISSAREGQPAFLQEWLSFWLHIVNINPLLFGYTAAIVETILAICFIGGIFSNMACVLGIVWALSIWTIPEAFGSPYIAGSSTDIGTAYPYIFMSLLLFAVTSGRYYGLDQLISAKLGCLSFLATGNRKM
jgi:uncharacterized membrane protein YphA (DoxX/SURF4 family)